MSNTIKSVENAMLTKIGDKVGGAKEALSTGGAQQSDGKPSAASAPQSDTVELTSGAKLLERLEKTLASLPDADPARVEAVKTAIANGDYKVDAGRIADALLRFDREFGA